jgi:hypothetical protein
MGIVAITRIQHGKPDGKVVTFGVGDNVTGLDEEEVKSLVLSGAAIETGKSRKYSVAPVAGEQDEETLKRDALIAKSASEANDEDETVTPNSDSAAKAVAAGAGTPAAPGGPGAANTQPSRNR